MSLPDFLKRLTHALDAAQVKYMVCGSVASFYHGVPRTTQDVDIVVELYGKDLPRLFEHLPEDQYYVSDVAARDAIRFEKLFNVVDMETGWKADLIVRKRRPFSLVEFERRQKVELMGVETWIASAEDTILSKLEWGQESESERQMRDARGIVELQGVRLDLDYLARWGQELGLKKLLAELGLTACVIG